MQTLDPIVVPAACQATGLGGCLSAVCGLAGLAAS